MNGDDCAKLAFTFAPTSSSRSGDIRVQGRGLPLIFSRSLLPLDFERGRQPCLTGISIVDLAHRVASKFAIVAMLLTAAAGFAPIVHADLIWRNDWTTSAPTPFDDWSQWLDPMPSAKIAFGSNGDAIIAGEPRNQYVQFIRLSSTGLLRWATNVNTDFDPPYAALAAPDGGAYLASPWGGKYEYQADLLVRVDASGRQMWSRPVRSGWLVQPSPDRIASAGCNWLTLLDAANGNVIWQRLTSAEYANCYSAGVVADTQGNFYATADAKVGMMPAGFRTVKLDANGSQIWNVVVPGSQHASIVGSSSAMLFEYTASDLRGVRKVDGSVAWTIPLASEVSVVVSDDGAGDPIIIGAGTVRRVAADTGQQRWSHSVAAGSPQATRVVGGSIVTTTSWGVFTRINAATGAVISTATLPAQDLAGNTLQWIDFGPLHDGSFLAVAYPLVSKVGAPPLFLQTIDFASSAPTAVVPVPSTPQGMYTTNLADHGSTVVSMGLDYQANAVNLRLHALDAATGTVAWECADTIDDLGPGLRFLPNSVHAAFAGSGIATAIALNQDGTYPIGGSRVALFDRVNGDRRWRTFLNGDNGSQSYTVVSPPIADAGGNVFISEGSGVSCGRGGPCNTSAVYKLAATNGAVLWQVDVDADPPGIMMLGSDVLAIGSSSEFEPISRLSNADGSVLWSSNLFSNPQFTRTVYQVDDGHIVVFGTTSTTTSWAKLDAATGAILWTRSVPAITCTGSACKAVIIDPLVLPNGDIVTGGGFDLNHGPFLRRFRNDGSGVVDDWNPLPSDPTQYSWINRTTLDADGRLRLYLRRGLSKYPPSIHFLATFNTMTGSLVDQQALVAYANDPSDQRSYPDLLEQIAADRYVVSTSSIRPPQPSTEGIALLDTTIHARGDLAVLTTLDQAHVMPGANVGFHIKVTYTGDQPLLGANLRGSMPWQSGITALNCAAQASTCTIGNTSGNVSASFDIQPGGSIDVSGNVKVLDSDTIPTLSAMVYGPIGLSEQDTRNNFASTAVTQSLFLDGFESH